MISRKLARELPGRDLFDRNGERIGEINQVFVDEVTDEPRWVTVKTGWFGLSDSFVPLVDVDTSGAGVRVAYDRATIKDAPRFSAAEPLTRRDEDELHTHYGLRTPAEQPTDPVGRGVETRGAAPGPDVAAVPRAGSAFDPEPEGARRGRLRPFDDPENREVSATAGIGEVPVRVCARCGGYVSADLMDRHEEFHRVIEQPAGDYARHDVSTGGRT